MDIHMYNIPLGLFTKICFSSCKLLDWPKKRVSLGNIKNMSIAQSIANLPMNISKGRAKMVPERWVGANTQCSIFGTQQLMNYASVL